MDVIQISLVEGLRQTRLSDSPVYFESGLAIVALCRSFSFDWHCSCSALVYQIPAAEAIMIMLEYMENYVRWFHTRNFDSYAQLLPLPLLS